MIHTKRRRPAQRFFMPHIGNLISEVMNTSLEDIVKNAPKNYTAPAVNVEKSEEAYVLTMALPGYAKEDVTIKVEKDVLTISSNRETKSEETYRLREFNYGSFERKFHLPKNVNQESVEAGFENGILKMTLALKPEALPKSIVIK
jgi:HSP20 family protein